MDGGAVARHAFRVLVALCAGVLLLNLLVPLHGEQAFEDWPFFPALLGLGASVVLVLCGRALRRGVARDEDYYG